MKKITWIKCVLRVAFIICAKESPETLKKLLRLQIAKEKIPRKGWEMASEKIG